MTVREILTRYLLENGYAGLAGEDCGCELGDLMPCEGYGAADCVPGVMSACDSETCPADGDCPWHMVPGAPPEEVAP